MNISKPEIFANEGDLPLGVPIKDAFSSSVEELFYVRNPRHKKKHSGTEEALEEFKAHIEIKPIWVYYPWLNQIVQTVPEREYYELFTARNKNIINKTEQENYRSFRIGIIGLSIGSTAVASLAMTGGPKFQRIADYDTVEISNLNRMKGTLLDIGENKSDVCARNTWMLDPFLQLDVYRNGVSDSSLESFITKDPGIEMFIDEMDSLDLKIKARIICRQKRIPVVMATDNGDSVILDIERYDLNPNTPLFNGLIEDLAPEQFASLTYKEWLSLATKIVGPDFLTERMQESLLCIGTEISSVPQLGTTANMAGAAVAYAVRRVSNKLPLDSGRYTFGLEQTIIPGYMDGETVEKRKMKMLEFIDKFQNK